MRSQAQITQQNSSIQLGKGFSCSVSMKCLNHKLVALKKVFLKNSCAQMLALNEASFLSACHHPNIIKFYSYYSISEEAICLETEYVSGGTLEKAKPNSLPFNIQKWMSQICSALIYIHERGIVHRDIKLNNLMIDQHGDIKVIDFGVSISEYQIRYELEDSVGTPHYMAPELIRRKKYNRAVDIYALGITLFVLLHSRLPFSGKNKQEYWQNALRDQIYYQCPQKWRFILSRMLDRDSENRITAPELQVLLKVHKPSKEAEWARLEKANLE